MSSFGCLESVAIYIMKPVWIHGASGEQMKAALCVAKICYQMTDSVRSCIHSIYARNGRKIMHGLWIN